MERLARAPPGYGVFVESASSSDGGGDALALAAEGGSEGGAGKKLEWETWPQEEDTGHTAWHKVHYIRANNVGLACVRAYFLFLLPRLFRSFFIYTSAAFFCVQSLTNFRWFAIKIPRKKLPTNRTPVLRRRKQNLRSKQ